MTTWKDNADTFRDLDAGDGWAFARLVACSVEKGAGTGRPPKETPAIAGVSGKVSAGAFATAASTSDKRVLRFLDAWDAAAAAGWCVHSDDLTPADATTTAEPDVLWKKRDEGSRSTIKAGGLYDSRTGLAGSKPESESGKRADAIRQQAEQDRTGPSKAIDIASNPKALAAAIKADPATAEAARKALIQKDIADAKPIKDAIRDRGPSPVSKALGNVAATVVLTPLREFTKIMAQINQDGSVLDGATVEALKDEMHRAMTEVQVAEHRAAVEAL